jgi:hypothetical protein
VDVRNAGHPDVAVDGRLAHERQRPPERDTEGVDSNRRGEDGEEEEPPAAPSHALHRQDVS